jgi:hypothetical protein
MVIIDRRLAGIFRYRKIWFATRDGALRIDRSLRSTDVVRFFAAPSNLVGLPHLITHRQLRTAWVDLSTGLGQVMNGMKRKSCRYEIQRAEKMLDRVEIQINSPRAKRDFLTVYNEFAKAKNLPAFRTPWIKEYSTHGEVLVLYLDGRALCCHLLLLDPSVATVRLLYSGSRRLETREVAAACGALNRYLHWYEMQRYHSQGFVTFDFGGIRDPGDAISRFKLSFGGAIVNENYLLVSGIRWITRLGNLAYESLRRQGTTPSKDATTVPLNNSAMDPSTDQ